MTKIITKYSGEKEPFDVGKFQRSIRRAGASESQVRDLTHKVLDNPSLKTTKEIYTFAYNYLRAENPPIAARYSLRSAIEQLGPTGFPFEQFVAHIFQAMGYTTQTDQTLQGKCITHETDVVLHKDNQQFVAECKFHQEHLKVQVQVPLYVKARFDDISARNKQYTEAWVITNTKFTTDSIAYAECVGLKLLGWGYPYDNGLARIIDRLGLHPITMLTTLSNKQKQMLLDQKIVLCQHMTQQRDTLRSIGLSEAQIENVLHEADKACEMRADETTS